MAGWLSEEELDKFRESGVEIGKNCRISPHSYIDRHGKVKIGDNVTITAWCRILSHDGAGVVVGMKIPDGCTEICSNTFLGLNSIVLSGIKIGKNVVIGAGSVVTRNVPDNEVWVGNPAHFIKTIEQFRRDVECKRKK